MGLAAHVDDLRVGVRAEPGGVDADARDAEAQAVERRLVERPEVRVRARAVAGHHRRPGVGPAAEVAVDALGGDAR